jgi:hypothetical protein
MSTPTELDEIDYLMHERVAAEHISPWRGSLPNITSRGRQLRRRQHIARGTGWATALAVSTLMTVGVVSLRPTGPLDLAPATPTWSTQAISVDSEELAEITQACREIGDLQGGQAQPMSNTSPIAVDRHGTLATAIYFW